MFTVVVVGTDGSSNAQKAVRVAANLAGPDTTLHVVAAYEPISEAQLRSMARDLPEEFRPLLYSDSGIDSILAGARSIVNPLGVKAEYHSVEGDPAEALIDTVEQLDADLLVVGSRGEGATKRLMHGSVSTKVLHHAPCAVLVVKK